MYILYITLVLTCVVDIYCGQSGYITLINESDEDWELIELQSFQMNAWNFPTSIKIGTVSHVYVEWSQDIFHRSSVDNGTAIYRLAGRENKTFRIEALADPFRIEVVLENIAIGGSPERTEYDLGWVRDGDVTFVLVEDGGRYVGTSMNAEDWMKNNLDILGNKTLKQISLPGTHDSGMSLYGSKSTIFSHHCNTLTQSHTVKGQLHLGVRYFDIRPVISRGEFMTGHYERIPGSWQGGTGQSMRSIVEDINDFTESRSEVIIISLSHSLNTDFNNDQYRKFDQSEWDSLLELLDKTNYSYCNQGVAVKLTQLTVNDFTMGGKVSAVIFLIRESGVELGHRLGKGYFYQDSIGIYDVYANSHKFSEMSEDQINKMIEYSQEYFFLLSWTLTQNAEEALFCPMAGVKSIKDLAKEANSKLAFRLYPEILPSSFPNIICIDDVKNTDITAIAMAINKKLNSF